MSDIHAVLLVPAEGDPLGLLAGPCGARPPVVGELRLTHARARDDSYLCRVCFRDWPCDQRGEEAPPRWVTDCARLKRRALVLAWDGEPVWQGIAVLDQHADKVSTLDPTYWPDGIPRAPGWVRSVEKLAAWGPKRLVPLGTLVLLDADGQEVEP